MRVFALALAASLALALACHAPGQAAVDSATLETSPMELVVYEHPDCAHCRVFRARVVPRYLKSDFAADAPLRFVNIAVSGNQNAALNGPITMVPTSVLMKDGREVDRIAGYWAPDNFFKIIESLIGKAVW
jgi:thiol-disulfide isomerase/thioredoxin